MKMSKFIKSFDLSISILNILVPIIVKIKDVNNNS